MTAHLLALSLSNSFTKVGAIAAFVALVGIAIMSLLVFSQAREIKRLRDWAGRAPERAAEVEQRVSADAAARLLAGQRPPGSPVGQQARVVPRKTPLVSAPVSTAVGVSAAAAAASASAQAAEQPATAAQPTTTAQPAATAQQATSPQQPAAANAELGVAPPAATAADSAQQRAAAPPASPTQAAAPATAPAQSASPSAEAEGRSPATEAGRHAPSALADSGMRAERVSPAIGPVSARDPSLAPRSPLPPSPQAPRPAAPRSSSIPSARPMPSRAVGPRVRAAVPAGVAATAAGAAAGSGRKDYRQERSRTRAIVLATGIVAVLVLALVLAVSTLKGGGSSAPTTTAGLAGVETAATTPTGSARHASGGRPVAASPGSTSVLVLNGTATTGLAHHLAADLQQSGYTRALASAAVPPGTHRTTVVEYSSGDRADAQGVARALNVTRVEPMDSTISGLSGSAAVVVLAGADQAALLGGGGAQSQGEPAAGQ